MLGKEGLFKLLSNGLKLRVIKGSNDKEVSNDFGSFVCLFLFLMEEKGGKFQCERKCTVEEMLEIGRSLTPSRKCVV